MHKSRGLDSSDVIKGLSLIIPCILLISTTFPTYSIFGYAHDVLESTDPDLYITINEQPMFQVISDDFYTTGLKAGYLLLFIFEVLSAVLLLAYLITVHFVDKKIGGWLFLADSSSLLISSIFVVALFCCKSPFILAFSLVSLLISIGCIVFEIVLKAKER